MFYGPPGCGKTYIAEALASEADTLMYKMGLSKICSKYINQTSKNINTAFDYPEEVSKKNSKPIILFMDEVDLLAIKRDSMDSSSDENALLKSMLKDK